MAELCPILLLLSSQVYSKLLKKKCAHYRDKRDVKQSVRLHFPTVLIRDGEQPSAKKLELFQVSAERKRDRWTPGTESHVNFLGAKLSYVGPYSEKLCELWHFSETRLWRTFCPGECILDLEFSLLIILGRGELSETRNSIWGKVAYRASSEHLTQILRV